MTDSKTSSWRFFFSLPLAQRIAITLWITLFIALSVKTILKPTSHSVFPVYFQAGINWWQQVDVYQVNQGIDHYRYSPTAAIFFSTFTFMGITLGAILWSFCSIVVFISFLRILLIQFKTDDVIKLQKKQKVFKRLGLP